MNDTILPVPVAVPGIGAGSRSLPPPTVRSGLDFAELFGQVLAQAEGPRRGEATQRPPAEPVEAPEEGLAERDPADEVDRPPTDDADPRPRAEAVDRQPRSDESPRERPAHERAEPIAPGRPQPIDREPTAAGTTPTPASDAPAEAPVAEAPADPAAVAATGGAAAATPVATGPTPAETGAVGPLDVLGRILPTGPSTAPTGAGGPTESTDVPGAPNAADAARPETATPGRATGQPATSGQPEGQGPAQAGPGPGADVSTAARSVATPTPQGQPGSGQATSTTPAPTATGEAPTGAAPGAPQAADEPRGLEVRNAVHDALRAASAADRSTDAEGDPAGQGSDGRPEGSARPVPAGGPLVAGRHGFSQAAARASEGSTGSTAGPAPTGADGSTPSQNATVDAAARTAGAERAAETAAAQRTPGSQDQIETIERIVKMARVTRAGERSTARVWLRPPELGTVRVSVTVDKGVVTANLSVETLAARDALTQQLPHLSQLLQDQGMQLGQVDVGLFGDGPQRQARADERSADGRRRSNDPAGDDDSIDSSDEAAPRVHVGHLGPDSVDVLV